MLLFRTGDVLARQQERGQRVLELAAGAVLVRRDLERARELLLRVAELTAEARELAVDELEVPACRPPSRARDVL